MLLAIAIGLIVGAIGGGGAILALPVLVYVLGEPVNPASTASLIVVAVGAAVGAGALARHGHVCWWLAVTFSVPAAAGSLLGTIAARHVSGHALILAFVPVMLVAAGATWQRSGSTRGEGRGDCPPAALARVLVAGLAVGALTGFFGVGGGFVIVPVLVLWLGAGFRRAAATSLVIITRTDAPSARPGVRRRGRARGGASARRRPRPRWTAGTMTPFTTLQLCYCGAP